MGWFFSSQKKAVKQLNETIESSMDLEERKLLYSSFDYDYDKSHQKHPHLLFHSFNLTCSINALYCSLSSDNGKPLCHASLSGIIFSGTVTQYDFEFSMGVSDLLVEDVTTVGQGISHVGMTMNGTKIVWPSPMSLHPRLGQGAGSAILVRYIGFFETKTSSVTARIQPINVVLKKDFISRCCINK